MATDYAVLRTSRTASTRSPFDVGPFATATSTTPVDGKIERAALSDADVLAAARDPSIAAMAPIMPMRLVEPVVAGPTATASGAWGVAAVGALASRFDGSGVAVAILDTGVDAAHPAFAGVRLIEKDFTGTGNGDRNGHGTHCAGTTFGRDVAGTRIGVAPGIDTALIGKVLDDHGAGQSDWIADAMIWASRSGASVISMSLGLDLPGMVDRLVLQGLPPRAATSVALEAYRANLRLFDATLALVRAQTAFDGGSLVVAAAGNESARDGAPPFRIATSLPAAAEHVVSVGAVDSTRQGFTVAPFSNMYPQVCAPGVRVLSAQTGGGLVELSGTSMATPHAAGVAALWWHALGGRATPALVAAKVLASAQSHVFAPGVDPADVGAGLIAAP